MALRPFTKPATTHADQVALLQKRGMIVPNIPYAIFHLKHLNYYRLGAYWLPFELDHATHTFRSGTTFDEVLSLYIFDRELRLLVLDAIERIEVSMRSQWAYEVAHSYGPHAHLDQTLAIDPGLWTKDMALLTTEVQRSKETFILHLQATYSEALPPIWAICEVMSLGLLSRWYSNLGDNSVRSKIAAHYGLDVKVLRSWLHHLSLLRNTCAHHGRLWNRETAVIPMFRHKPAALLPQVQIGSKKIYNSLVIMLYLMDIVSPGHSWRIDLIALLQKNGGNLSAMGFLVDWDKRPIWR
jgi:abortive infection bacteriophage resistance protein